MTPARFTVGMMVTIIIVSGVFHRWLDYWMYLVFAALLLLVPVVVGLALACRPVDTLALQLLATILVLWLGPGTFIIVLQGLGIDVPTRFHPYVNKAVWFDSLRTTVLSWGAAFIATIITYAYRFGRVRRETGTPPSAVSLFLLLAGLPGWILLPTGFFILTEGGPGAVGFGLFAPLILATFAVGKLGFRAVDRNLSDHELLKASVLSTGMALLSFLFLGVSWVAGDELRGRVDDYRGRGHWDLLRWHQLGAPLMALAMVWLLLGAWLGRQWSTKPIIRDHG